MTNFYDNHTLYVNSGVATKEQLSTAIRQALKNVSKALGREIKTLFKPNVIIVRGSYVGYSYVRVQNPEVYNMLIGRNPDGTERVEYKDDPNWIAPKKAVVDDDLDGEMDFDIDSFLKQDNGSKSWADMMEDEDPIVPQLKILLPPLMTLPPYEYDTEQIQHVRNLLVEQAMKCNQSSDNIVVPTHGHFEVSRAYVGPVEEKYSANVLCARNIPAWITPNDLKSAFVPYASDSTTKHKRKVEGRFVQESYPFVTINNGRVAFVTFDPSTHDAQFALLMTRKLDLESRDKKNSVQLVFSHAFKTGSRDQ